jgi:hypothetical protein
MRTMIWLLTQRLHREGFRWVAFTGTTSLRNAFRRIGLEPVDLGPADARRLPPATTQWGSYYEQGPRVFAGRIDDGVRTLAQSGAPARSQQLTASA